MKKVLLLVLAFSFLTVNSYSQEDVLRPNGRTDGGGSYSTSYAHPWALGLEAGLTYNKYGADLNWTDMNGLPSSANSINNVFESLDGLSPHLGVFVDYDLSDMFGIHLKLLYNAVKYSNNHDGIVDFTDVQTGQYIGTGISNMDITDSYNFFNIEPHLRINATNELYFLVGPSFQFGFGSENTDIIYTENEDFVTYNTSLPNEGQSSKTQSADTSFSDTRIAFNLGVGYKFQLSDNIYLAPQIIYNLGLSTYEDVITGNTNQLISQEPKILKISNQTLNQIRFSITLWFENL